MFSRLKGRSGSYFRHQGGVISPALTPPDARLIVLQVANLQIRRAVRFWFDPVSPAMAMGLVRFDPVSLLDPNSVFGF